MKKKGTLLLAVLFFVAFPYLFPNDYFIHILIMSGINVLLVLSLNMISGYTGQVSFGHAAFFGIGAYTSALLSLKGIPVWAAMLLSAPAAALCGFLVGYPVLRLKGHFFAIATLGFGEIVHLVLNNWVDVTRGPMGLSGIPKPGPILAFDFSTKTDYYLFILLLVGLTVYLSIRMKLSKTGRALLAIRTDEITAGAMGIHVPYHKMFAFTWSAAIAGLAGAFYAHYVLFISPETFKLAASINILLMLLIGGMGSISGSVLGGLFMTVLSEYLRAFAEYQMLIYGVMIVLVVIFAPRGLSGLLDGAYRKFRQAVVKGKVVKGKRETLKGGAEAHESTNT